MAALPGFKGFIAGLWVADSDLFEPTYSRRLLFGLSAHTWKPLMLVPAMRDSHEVPSALTHSLLCRERRSEAKLVLRLRYQINTWLQSKMEEERLFQLREIDSQADTIEATVLLQHCFEPDQSTWRYPRDVDIVVESLIAGAEFIVTNNLRTIRHSDLNNWARENLGFNRDLVGDATSLTRRYLQDTEETLQLIANMSVSGKLRSEREEINSIRLFIDGLKGGAWNRSAFECEEVLAAIGQREREDLLSNASEAAKNTQFRLARQAEEELQEIRAQCLLEADINNEIAPLFDREKQLIRKFSRKTKTP